MYKTCPGCGHTRADHAGGDADVCPNCGLIFSKWMRNRFRDPRLPDSGMVETSEVTLWSRLRISLGYVPPASRSQFGGRVLAFALFLIWGGYFLSLGMDYGPIGASFMHLINLVFHEAGHVLFRPFGQFMTILGGSLLQILIPMIVALSLLLKNRDTFGAAIGLWWTGQSMIDIAPYINDARSLSIPLLGGGTGMDRPGMHDWRNILLDLDLLSWDHAIASTVMFLGKALVVLALIWAGFYLARQRKQLTDL